MSYINCARNSFEQNLVAVQSTDGAIYYDACRDMTPGTELLVWYGDGYVQFMGVPVALKPTASVCGGGGGGVAGGGGSGGGGLSIAGSIGGAENGLAAGNVESKS